MRSIGSPPPVHWLSTVPKPLNVMQLEASDAADKAATFTPALSLPARTWTMRGAAVADGGSAQWFAGSSMLTTQDVPVLLRAQLAPRSLTSHRLTRVFRRRASVRAR